MDEKTIARFWRKVDKRGPDECWEWTGAKRQRGYGSFKGPVRNGVRLEPGPAVLTAHRVSYVLAHGPVPNGLLVLHRCDNPPCCNPAHLWLGTDAENARDKMLKGRVGLSDIDFDAVRAIRAARASGVRLRVLAAKYGVSMAAISRIAGGVNYAHVTSLTAPTVAPHSSGT